MEGLFITFEGIEGSGKTTQIRILADYLKLRGRDVLVTREPGGTPIGEKIRKVLLHPEFKEMAPLTELFLYAAARCQHVTQVIRPALEAGKIVISDRYFDATRAYQGAARSIDPEFLSEIHKIATGGLSPHLTFLLDCAVEIGLRRAQERQSGALHIPFEDRFEREALEFHERVRAGYLAISMEEPGRVKVLDAMEDVDTLHQKTVDEVIRWM